MNLYFFRLLLLICIVVVSSSAVSAQELATSSAVLESAPIVISEDPTGLNATGGSLLQIFAAGTPLGGVYPVMQVIINDSLVTSFDNVRGDAKKRIFQEFQYVSVAPLDIHGIRLRFANDSANFGEDRNLRIDRVVLDGVEYQTESPTTYHFSEYYCSSGYVRTEWVNCPESIMFEYTPPPTPTPKCATHGTGDADCNQTVNLVDFEIWRKEYDGTLKTLDADFNNDKKTNVVDFEIWRQSYLN